MVDQTAVLTAVQKAVLKVVQTVGQKDVEMVD